MEQVGGHSTQQGGLFTVPLKLQYSFAQKVKMHVLAAACVCGFLKHMFMFNCLHICAGSESSSPRRNDHSLSGLIKHILNLNDVGVSDFNLFHCFDEETQSPMTCTINSIFSSGKCADPLAVSIRSDQIVFPWVQLL